MSRTLWAGLMLSAALAPAWGAEGKKTEGKPSDAAAAPTYRLRYQFQPGDTLRWEVVLQQSLRTNIAGTSKLAETMAKSVKVWQVKDVAANGNATFEHAFESVDMWHRTTSYVVQNGKEVPERHEARYNSLTDKEAPPGYREEAESIGPPLLIVTVDRQGKTVSRKRVHKNAPQSETEMTVLLPEQPVAVGQSWSFPHDLDVPLADGLIKKVRIARRYTLAEVTDGVAVIRVESQVLTPLDDAAVEALVIDQMYAATVRFDIGAGRLLDETRTLDRGLVGFHGEASSLHNRTRMTQHFLAPDEVAAKPGPTAGVK